MIQNGKLLNIKFQFEVFVLRLHTREMQYRLEIDHLKSELQDDKNKIQQLERELLEIKLKQLSNNETSVDVNFSE
jgi:predicted RNase H-like nuclease (RuvC/YqgF family)